MRILLLIFFMLISPSHAFDLKGWILSELQKLLGEEEKIQDFLCGPASIFPFRPSVQMLDGTFCSVPEIAPIAAAICFGAPNFNTSACYKKLERVFGGDPYAQIEKIASDVRQIQILQDIACKIASKKFLPLPQQKFFDLVCTGTTSALGQTTPILNPATEASATLAQANPQQTNLSTSSSIREPAEASDPTPQSPPIIQAIVENAIQRDLNVIITNKVQQVVEQAVDKALNNLGQQVQPPQLLSSLPPPGDDNPSGADQTHPVQQGPPENDQSSQRSNPMASSQAAEPNPEHDDGPQNSSNNRREETEDLKDSIMKQPAFPAVQEAQ